jgi:branched-chain amino acid transport system permease protein
MVDFPVLAMTLAMVILGGAGSVPGVILGTIIITGYNRVIIPQLGEFLAQLQTGALPIVIAPDVRGLNYLNFGLALYLTVLLRARRRGERETARTEAQPVD